MAGVRKEGPAAPPEAEPPVPPSDQAPKFILPGDNPELDALVARLREGSDDGDPLFRRPKSHGAGARSAEVPGGEVPRAKGPVDKSSEPASLGALAVDRRMARKGLSTRWVLLAIIAMVMPVLALALGVVLKYRPGPAAELPPAQATTATEPATRALPASIPAAALSSTAPPSHLDAPSPGPRASSVRAEGPGGRSVPVPRPPKPAPERKTPKPGTTPPDDPGLIE